MTRYLMKMAAASVACFALVGCDTTGQSFAKSLSESTANLFATANGKQAADVRVQRGESRPAPSASGLRRTYSSGVVATPERAAELDRLAVQAAAYRLVVQVRNKENSGYPADFGPSPQSVADLVRDQQGLALARTALIREIERQEGLDGEDLSSYKQLAAQLDAAPGIQIREIIREKPLRRVAEPQARQIYARQVPHLAG